MKKIISILIGLVMCFSLTSCVTVAEAQATDVIDDVDVTVVVTNGVPCYSVSGLLLYYTYGGMYYYPHHMNNRWYFRRYHSPLPHTAYRPYPRDFYRHKPSHYSHRPHIGNNRPNANGNVRFGGGVHRPQGGNHNRPSGGHGHFGSRR